MACRPDGGCGEPNEGSLRVRLRRPPAGASVGNHRGPLSGSGVPAQGDRARRPSAPAVPRPQGRHHGARNQRDVRIITNRSAADSAPHTSPGRPRSCRTSAGWLSAGKLTNVSVVGSSGRSRARRVAQPDDIPVVDVDGVGGDDHRAAAIPASCRWRGRTRRPDRRSTRSPTGVPGSRTRRAAAPHQRWVDRHRTSPLVDPPTDVAAGQRAVVDLAVGGCGDAVWAAAARRGKHLHRAGRRVEPAVDAVLAGEPEHASPSKTRF